MAVALERLQQRPLAHPIGMQRAQQRAHRLGTLEPRPAAAIVPHRRGRVTVAAARALAISFSSSSSASVALATFPAGTGLAAGALRACV